MQDFGKRKKIKTGALLHGGRPYIPYIPDQMSRVYAAIADSAGCFKDFDAKLARMPRIGDRLTDYWADGISAKVLNGEWDADRPQNGRFGKAVVQLASQPISVKSILHAAGELAECIGELRSGPMWVGADSPEKAWFVAPPPPELPRLLSDLVAFCSNSNVPASMRASVALTQFLLIHPFRDGNGRTARALFSSIIVREIGDVAAPMGMLRFLWTHHAMRLHSSQLEIRKCANWLPFLALASEALEKRCG